MEAQKVEEAVQDLERAVSEFMDKAKSLAPLTQKVANCEGAISGLELSSEQQKRVDFSLFQLQELGEKLDEIE